MSATWRSLEIIFPPGASRSTAASRQVAMLLAREEAAGYGNKSVPYIKIVMVGGTKETYFCKEPRKVWWCVGGAVSFDLHSIPPTFEGASVFIVFLQLAKSSWFW